MCFCVFAVGFELLRMQEMHVRGCFTNRVSEFALVAEPAKVIDKPDHVLCTNKMSGAQAKFCTKKNCLDPNIITGLCSKFAMTCWILVF